MGHVRTHRLHRRRLTGPQHELEQIWADVRRSGHGAHVRLVGAGARALAACFVATHGAQENLGATQTADATVTIAWFDGEGAAVVAADRCALSVALLRHPWLVLTTVGDAVGLPLFGVTLEVSAHPAGSGQPTQVEDPTASVRDLEAWVKSAVDQGDLAGAYLGYTQMVARGAEASHWASLEVSRLARLYRREDASRRAQILSARGVPPGEMLAELARLDQVGGDWRRADRLAELSETDHGEHIRGLVAANLGRIPWGSVPAARPCWGAGVQVVRALIEFDDLSVVDAFEGSVYRRALRLEFGTDRRPLLSVPFYCALGRADDAWRAAVSDSENAEHLLRIAHRPVTRDLTRVEHLLPGDPLQALQLLDEMQPRLEAFAGLHFQQSALLRAVSCALLGDRLGFYTAIAVLHHETLRTRAWHNIHRFGVPSWAAARLVDLGAPIDFVLPERPVVMGDFIAFEPVGEGGMGEVWRGEHGSLGLPVAIKVMRIGDAGSVEGFEAEIDAVSRLDHPAIVQVLDVGRLGEAAERQTQGTLVAGTPFLVMELASGTLESFSGCLAWEETRDILIALLDALIYAHARGVVHRDIKPSNILFMEAPSGATIRLSDFGLVGVAPGKPMGTPAYLAPEVWARAQFGPASDLYAVGCLAVCLLTGVPPFVGDSKGLAVAHLTREPNLQVDEIPVVAREWIGGLLRKDPAERVPALEARAVLFDLIAPDVPSLPGRIPHAEPRDSATTFVLDTLLGWPEPDALVPSPVRSAVLPAEWRGTRALRRRLPTPRLWARGDPPIVGRERVQDRLWAHLREVLQRQEPLRVRLVGPRGSGRKSLVRWLARRAAELCGHCALAVARAPPPGLTVLDSQGLSAEVVEPWLVGPVLVIWTEGGPADVEAIELPVMDSLNVASVLLERVPLELSSLVRLSDTQQTLGRPGLALAHLEAAVPFSRPVPGRALLRTRHVLPREPSGVLQWWRHALATDVDPPTLAALEIVAVLGVVSPGDVEALTGDAEGFERCADWLGWEVPYSLPRGARQVLLERMGGRAREIRQRAAVALPDPLRRECQVAYFDPRGADLQLLVDAAWDRRWFEDVWSAEIVEAAQRVLTARLLRVDDPRRAPVELLQIEVQRTSEHSLESYFAGLEQYIAKWAVQMPKLAAIAADRFALHVRRRSLPGIAEAVQTARELAQGEPDTELASIAARVFWALSEGCGEDALALIASRPAVVPAGDSMAGWCFFTQARAAVLPLAEAAALVESALSQVGGAERALLHRDLGAFYGGMGNAEAAVRHSLLALELSYGPNQVSMLANLSLGLCALGRRSEASLAAVRGTRSAVRGTSPLLGFFHRVMFATRTDWKGRGWEAGWAVLPECELDPDIVEVLERGVQWAHGDGQPTRAALLEAEADRIRSSIKG